MKKVKIPRDEIFLELYEQQLKKNKLICSKINTYERQKTRKKKIK